MKNTEKRICEYCGREFTLDIDGIEFESVFMCDSCAEDYTVICDDCSERIW